MAYRKYCQGNRFGERIESNLKRGADFSRGICRLLLSNNFRRELAGIAGGWWLVNDAPEQPDLLRRSDELLEVHRLHHSGRQGGDVPDDLASFEARRG